MALPKGLPPTEELPSLAALAIAGGAVDDLLDSWGRTVAGSSEGALAFGRILDAVEAVVGRLDRNVMGISRHLVDRIWALRGVSGRPQPKGSGS